MKSSDALKTSLDGELLKMERWSSVLAGSQILAKTQQSSSSIVTRCSDRLKNAAQDARLAASTNKASGSCTQSSLKAAVFQRFPAY